MVQGGQEAALSEDQAVFGQGEDVHEVRVVPTDGAFVRPDHEPADGGDVPGLAEDAIEGVGAAWAGRFAVDPFCFRASMCDRHVRSLYLHFGRQERCITVNVATEVISCVLNVEVADVGKAC